MKKFFAFILLTIFIIGGFTLFFFVTYKVIESYDKKSKIERLDKYKLMEKEKEDIKIDFNGYTYVITKYTDEKSRINHNILVSYENNYYYIDSLENCDMSSYVKENQVYTHCLGGRGNILKYSFSTVVLNKDYLELNYSTTPNISEIHMTVDKVDNKNNIYLSSNVKVDDSIEEGNKIKCNIETRACKYIK